MAITWAPTVTTSGGPGIYLVRYNSSGVATQAKVFPVSSLNTLGVTTYPGLGLCAFPDGTCAITGSTTVAAAFDTYTMTASSSGYVSAFIAHMKSDFTTDWLVEISSSKGHCYEMGAQSIAATPDGGMVTTGNYYTVTGS